MMNIMNGGSHSDAPIDIQEFMIMPKGASSFREALQMGCEIFHALKSVLKSKGLSTAVGDEGGFAPALESNEAALEVIAQAVKKAGYKLGKDIFFALDVASSEFYDAKSKKYVFGKSDGAKRNAKQMVEFYEDLQKKFPILSIEDGCDENDWAGWKVLTDAIGDKTQLVGDDLFVTNTKFLKKGIDNDTANSILVKVNQIGTLTETLDAVEMAKEATATPPSFRTAPARRRTPRSPISRWPPIAGRSRPAHSAAPTASPNTTSSSASRKSSATTPSTAVRSTSRGLVTSPLIFKRPGHTTGPFLAPKLPPETSQGGDRNHRRSGVGFRDGSLPSHLSAKKANSSLYCSPSCRPRQR